MSFLFKIASFIGLAFLLSCYLPPNVNAPNQPAGTANPNYQQGPVIGQPFTGDNQQPGGSPVIQPSRDDDRNEPEPDRRRGSGCEKERSSHSCHQLCREMYSRDRDECLEEEPNTIENIYEVYRSLEDVDFDSINLEDFEVYLDVSTFSLTSLLRDYDRKDAEDMLIWIAEDDEVAELIRGEDEDFRILNDLLSLMVRFDNTKIDIPFTRRIDNRDNLMDYALNFGNDEALDYFIEYILTGSQACKGGVARDEECLRLMCKIGRANDERDRDHYFDSRVFEDFISEIIDEGINGTDSASGDINKWIKGRGDEQIDDFNDLDFTWAGDIWAPSNGEMPICGGL